MSGFVNDEVEGWTPASFALEVVRKLRRDKRCSHKPSLRMTLAVPRFLTARYCRTRRLTPRDYLEAARLNTVPEDQHLAEEIARALLFPDVEERKKTDKKKAEAAEAVAADPAATADPMAGILGDLASLDLDFDNLESLDLDAIEGATGTDNDAADVFDLFERLYSSADYAERALAELVVSFGGPAELQGVGADTVGKVRGYVQASLMGTVGALSPEQVMHGCRAGFADELKREVRQPWELAGALCGDGQLAALQDHVVDLESADARTFGLVLAYLKPHTKKPGELDRAWLDDLTADAIHRATDLGDVAELLTSYGEWLDPPEDLLQISVDENVGRALEAGRRIEERFGQPMRERLFAIWAAGLQGPASVFDLVGVAVPCAQWAEMLSEAWKRHLQSLVDLVATVPASGALPTDVLDTVALAEGLQRTKIEDGAKLATEVATEAMCIVPHEMHFLPLLDEFLGRRIIPHDIERVIAAGQALGVDPNEIYDRLGDALEQLRGMIMGGSHQVDRYKRLVDKVVRVPDELMDEMVQSALGTSNIEAMAALLAVDLGAAAERMPDEAVTEALGYKGIGDGSNLLKQWFTHRRSMRDSIRDQIKLQVKDALLELAFDWINKGEGSTERGLIPQTNARPYTAGDEMDSLDLESTLDSIISGGKALDAVTHEDLFVHDASKGQAALCVLIDISGSMGGGELAMCAIAVVMLLGRVKPSEIALAVFESDTHVIKPFADEASLDEVADKVLELEATGGTRVDAALEWAREELESTVEAEFRLLFLLSDFMFFEKADELARHCRAIGDLGTQLLAASHGYSDDKTIRLMVDATGGQHVSLKSVQALPAILIDTLRQIGDGAMS